MKKDILLLGAPGAGKGTQAKFLEKEYNLIKIDTGNIIRNTIKEATELGMQAKKYVEQGKLVPDELVINLIVNTAKQIKQQQKNFLLDGFPRNLQQAKALEENKLFLDLVIEIESSAENLIERISNRRLCTNKNCGGVFNLKSNKSKQENICDFCGSSLYQRDDDKEELIKTRFETYLKETLPLSEFYSKQNKLIKIDGNKDVEEVWESIKKYLSKN